MNINAIIGMTLTDFYNPIFLFDFIEKDIKRESSNRNGKKIIIKFLFSRKNFVIYF